MSLESIRGELKVWENTFKEINGRKPSKSDVDVAPAKIKGLYREYSALRKGGSVSNQPTTAAPAPLFRLKRTEFSLSKPIYPIRFKPYCEKADADGTKQPVTKSREETSILCGIRPNFGKEDGKDASVADPIGQKQFVSYYHSLSSFEIAVKRQNLCNLAAIDVDGGSSSSEEEDVDEAEAPIEDDGASLNDSEGPSTSENVELAPFETEKPKRKPSTKSSNTNFVRLDMKHKRYQAKALKRMKGAALKRFLFRQRMRKQRNA